MNEELEEPFFLEKALMYTFNQRIREKSFCLTGDGGNGKGIFMLMVDRLFGKKAYTDAPQPIFNGHAPAVIAYSFIGKRLITFNDVKKPDENMLEWMKRMITGNLEVKTPSGAWLSVPTRATFMMETNYVPEILEISAHRRRYIVKEFRDREFQLTSRMTDEELDIVGERGSITAADIVAYLVSIKPQVKNWIKFGADVEQAPHDVEFEQLAEEENEQTRIAALLGPNVDVQVIDSPSREEIATQPTIITEEEGSF
jgi:phage/plasmid-associated DNA primase